MLLRVDVLFCSKLEGWCRRLDNSNFECQKCWKLEYINVGSFHCVMNENIYASLNRYICVVHSSHFRHFLIRYFFIGAMLAKSGHCEQWRWVNDNDNKQQKQQQNVCVLICMMMLVPELFVLLLFAENGKNTYFGLNCCNLFRLLYWSINVHCECAEEASQTDDIGEGGGVILENKLNRIGA